MFPQHQVTGLAKLVIQMYGPEASDYADRQMQHYMKLNDVQAASDWFAVGHAIALLTNNVAAFMPSDQFEPTTH
jgi:hypothetical protein